MLASMNAIGRVASLSAWMVELTRPDASYQFGAVISSLGSEPAFDDGRAPATWTMGDDDSDPHTADGSGADQTMRLRSDVALGVEGSAMRGRHVLREGDSVFCSLSWSTSLDGPASRDEVTRGLVATSQFWRRWLARTPDHRLRTHLERSALTIKGLTYVPTGATVAAATTSLPETPGGERNWDYRFTSMRDTTFTLQALHFLNLDWEADEFLQFVADVEPHADGGLQIMYGIDGRRDLTGSHWRHARTATPADVGMVPA